MWWLILVLVLAALAGIFLSIWRKWIEPWKCAEQLAQSLVDEQPPSSFLLSANPFAQKLGLALEKLWERQHGLRERVHESEFSVHAILGAMLDGLVVLDEERRIQMTN